MDKHMEKKIFERAKNFIYQNARPLDLARWQFHFENGTKESVLNALASYQNEDGGFGHGLEADCLNPYSSPIQTWAATCIIRELGGLDKDHPIIKSILDYLEHTKDFDGTCWANTIQSNNEYPHALWWQYPHPPWWKGESLQGNFIDQYNPSAELAGFVLLYGEENSNLYDKAVTIAKKGIKDLVTIENPGDMHVISNFIALYGYICEAKKENAFDTVTLLEMLRRLTYESITQDTSIWNKNYICKPSQFFNTKVSPFYEQNAEIAQYECKYIAESQLEDGSYSVPWKWDGYPDVWPICKNWWKGHSIITNMLYLKGMAD